MIPYALKYTSTVTGGIPKVVDCEGCQKQYVYFLQRTVTGEATSFLFLENEEARQGAEEEARIELAGRLARSCDPVPCPRCGWYQQQMVKRAKSLHQAWMITAGLAGILVAVPLAILSWIVNGMGARAGWAQADSISSASLILAIAGVIIGVALLFWRNRAIRRFNPNDADAADRIEEARERALAIEDYAVILASQQPTDGRAEFNPLPEESTKTVEIKN